MQNNKSSNTREERVSVIRSIEGIIQGLKDMCYNIYHYSLLKQVTNIMCENCNYNYKLTGLCSLSIGDYIPEVEFEVFRPANEGGNKEELTKMNTKDFKGRWTVLIFYPADFTFVCPTELEEVAEMYDEFKKEGAEVISVSTDTVFCHKSWHDSSEAIRKVKYPMASDANHILSEMFGVLIEDEGLALRGTFVINPEGKIVLVEINDNSIGRSAKELLRKLKAAKFVAEHDGKVCPASWTENNDTLEPGLSLIGKI